MIVITGALGFIGSCLVSFYNKKGYTDIIAVDDFSQVKKHPNLVGKVIREKVERQNLKRWLAKNGKNVNFMFHIGARTDTTEFDTALLDRLNLNYTKMVWEACIQFNIPLIYASSAATYGLGEYGFKDNHGIVPKLKPLNPYGRSKNDFDKWALSQSQQPIFWAGLKFFNVYGPNEYHKGRMASVIFHFFHQIQNNKSVKLFRSHNPAYANGEQKRDFIYVKDVLSIIDHLHINFKNIRSGLYNVGTGKARTFNDLAASLFKTLQLPTDIQYIDTPKILRKQYQYFTEANMAKLKSIDYSKSFTTLELGINDYINNFLNNLMYF